MVFKLATLKEKCLYLNWLIILTGFFYLGTVPVKAAPQKVQIQYFYSDTCQKCISIKENYLPKVLNQYGKSIQINYIEISSVPNYQLLLTLEKKLGRPISKTPPLIICGQDVLEGPTIIQQRLAQVIQKHLREKVDSKFDQMNTSNEQGKAVADFSNISLFAVISGGLLDGINPCAFTTLIFLISFFSFSGRNKQQIIVSGAMFTLGVFVSYFLIGFGLLALFQQFLWFTWVGKGFTLLIVIGTIALAVLNFYDYRLIKQGKVRDTKLQLGIKFKQKIHTVIRQGVKWKAYSLASFGVGFLVALIEFPCTGQIYFPIIFMLRGVGYIKTLALFYLLIYNLMFILPLIFLFGLAYWGVSSQSVSVFMLKNAGKVKLLTALLFICLAILTLVVGF